MRAKRKNPTKTGKKTKKDTGKTRTQRRSVSGRAKTQAKGQRKPSSRGSVKSKKSGSPRKPQFAELAVELTIRAADGTTPESKQVKISAIVRPPRQSSQLASFPGVKARETLAKRISRGIRTDRLARSLAAIAHPQRLLILFKLLAGEANHKLLAKETGLKAGPLYYHLRELREAGLIGPRVRDLYTLTRKGRRIILAAVATDRLCK